MEVSYIRAIIGIYFLTRKYDSEHTRDGGLGERCPIMARI